MPSHRRPTTHPVPSTRRHRRRRAAVGAVALLGVTGSGAALAAGADNRGSPARGPIHFEVTENSLQVAFDPDITFEDGMPSYGAPFITQGYVYPRGTLVDGADGINADGSPEFPEVVVGTWLCFGHMIGDGVRTESGAWVASTQLYDIDGVGTIVTDGTELIDLDVETDRAVTGGTGGYRSASGVQRQTLQGFNELEGVVLSVRIDLDGSGS